MSRLRTSLALALLLLAAAPALAGARYATSDEGSKRRSDAYREGQRALDDQEWDEASRIFGKLAAGSTDETDAALYWKAYADWKQKQKKASLEGLRQLLSDYPDSDWTDDARALEQEIRGGSAGSGTTAAADDELKLYALDSLMHMEPEQAIPVLERLLFGNASLRIKERALFVLSQSDSPRAREILLRIARTGQPIRLRCEAVKTLGIAGEPEDIAVLATLARDTAAPPEVRAALIEAYIISGQSDGLIELAKSDPDPKMRLKAIEALGVNGDVSALRQLWTTEKNPEVREKLLQSFGLAGDVDTLAKAARESTDPELRGKAVEGLAISENPAASDLLGQLYRAFRDPDDKRKVAEAFMIRDDAKGLIALFRAETDPAMKKVLLQQLSIVGDPEAARLILEVLEAKP